MRFKIPRFVAQLFWDTDVTHIDVYAQNWYVIERIINFGNMAAIKWMLDTFPRHLIEYNLRYNYNISTNALNLWSQLLSIDPSQCKCTLRPSVLRAFD